MLPREVKNLGCFEISGGTECDGSSQEEEGLEEALECAVGFTQLGCAQPITTGKAPPIKRGTRDQRGMELFVRLHRRQHGATCAVQGSFLKSSAPLGSGDGDGGQ
jgi:hypothetical protein